ncbi:MAG: helix-turn-helix domain-containing protein [Candidatus Poribacteria bacterium]|jgi:hypothetical protein|nr:helix-turn-helix domain-containing protein [Candidatus Poribacteria bacterium]MDP6748957.1 helix-turn-helix domain-containing protein [Candidatus Poribacteria bacterium]MDP6997571.1 helix-turn-helix domain-containing protein [Candidatus Poribacteria bacterium]
MISVSQARQKLGISAQSVRRLIKEESLISHKGPNGRWMIDETSLEQLTQQRNATSAQTQHTIVPNLAKNAPTTATTLLPTPSVPPVNTKWDYLNDSDRFRYYVDLFLQLSDQLYTTPQQLVSIFQQNITRFQRPGEFSSIQVRDYSIYFDQLILFRKNIDGLADLDLSHIDHLFSEEAIWDLSEIPEIDVLKRYLLFDGQASKREFWWSTIWRCFFHCWQSEFAE